MHLPQILRQIETEFITVAINKANGNMGVAAKMLSIPQSDLTRRKKKLGLEISRRGRKPKTLTEAGQ